MRIVGGYFLAFYILHHCSSSSVKQLPFWNLGFHRELSKWQECPLALGPTENTIHPKTKIFPLPGKKWRHCREMPRICGLASTVEAELYLGWRHRQGDTAVLCDITTQESPSESEREKREREEKDLSPFRGRAGALLLGKSPLVICPWKGVDTPNIRM